MSLLTPPYGEQIQTFPEEAYRALRDHSITRYARHLRESGIQIEFRRAFASGGYLTQGTMVERVLQEVFPDAFREPEPQLETKSIRIFLYDSPLNHPWWFSMGKSESWNDPGVLEMSRMKSGNPLIAPASRNLIRGEFHIPENARMVHAYMNHDEVDTLHDLYQATSIKPDYILISLNKDFISSKELSVFEGYPILTLATLPEVLPPRAILLNDLKHRMLELYTASDYAFVIGANNIFEPLRAKCPVLFFKNSRPLWVPNFFSPISYYHPQEWNRMAAIAERTGGGIGISGTWQARSAIRRLLAIDRNAIRNPAFTNDAPGGRTAFELLLDDLEAHLRHHIERKAPWHSR